MKHLVISLLLLSSTLATVAQANALPLKEWSGAAETPFVLYISGDGGFNSFSTSLCTAIHNAGYLISAVNAKSYFWNKKTPRQTAMDFAAYLTRQFNARKNQQLILVGYSFGADVLPFMVNELPDGIAKKITAVILLSPSRSTDFEIHWYDMFGGNKQRGMDVVSEMNKMRVQKTVTIFGSDETDFPLKDIRLKNYVNEILPGGHHFDGNTDEVAKTIMKYFLVTPLVPKAFGTPAITFPIVHQSAQACSPSASTIVARRVSEHKTYLFGRGLYQGAATE